MAHPHTSTVDDARATADTRPGGQRGGRRRVVRVASSIGVALMFVVAVGSSIGWYHERQWDPSSPVDQGCTIAADRLITLSFYQEAGDLASVLVTSEPDRVVVGVRTEHVRGRGAYAGTGGSATYSTMLERNLEGRPVVYADGTVLPCPAVPPRNRRGR